MYGVGASHSGEDYGHYHCKQGHGYVTKRHGPDCPDNHDKHGEHGEEDEICAAKGKNQNPQQYYHNEGNEKAKVGKGRFAHGRRYDGLAGGVDFGKVRKHFFGKVAYVHQRRYHVGVARLGGDGVQGNGYLRCAQVIGNDGSPVYIPGVKTAFEFGDLVIGARKIFPHQIGNDDALAVGRYILG